MKYTLCKVIWGYELLLMCPLCHPPPLVAVAIAIFVTIAIDLLPPSSPLPLPT